MTEITAALVKTLRDRTGAGMMACKNALVNSNGDIEQAIDSMRKAGQATAAKKAGRIAAEGVIQLKIDPQQQRAILVEINCETDFVAKDAAFLAFSDAVADQALRGRYPDLEHLTAACEAQRLALLTKLGENVHIRRLATLEGGRLGGYLHDNRIGVLVAATPTTGEELVRQIAMHIAASKPEYVRQQDVPAEMIARERQIQLEIAMQSGNSATIAEKMVEGRLRKFVSGLVLVEQPFVMETSQCVGDLLRNAGADISGFFRFEVGEGLLKIKADFAAEVAAASKVTE